MLLSDAHNGKKLPCNADNIQRNLKIPPKTTTTNKKTTRTDK